MSDEARLIYRRIVVGFCHGVADTTTMRMVAEFARLLGLDLHCFFIEDEAVLALAQLPFAREIRLPTHEWSPLTADAVEADIGRAATQARQLINDIIAEIGVPSEFEVLRGDPAACIAAVCQKGDIVVLFEGAPAALVSHSLAPLRTGAHEAATSIPFVPTSLKTQHGPVVVVLSDGGDPVLDVACKLALTTKEDLAILVTKQLGGGGCERAVVRVETMGLPRSHTRVKEVDSLEADDVLHALTGVQERMIILPRGASTTAASRIAVTRRVPLLLVGNEPTGGQGADRGYPHLCLSSHMLSQMQCVVTGGNPLNSTEA